MTDDIIITVSNFCGKSIIKSLIISLYAVIHKLSTTTEASNTSFIIIVVRKAHLISALCIHIVLLYVFYIKQLFTNMFLFHFQTNDNDMHAYEDSWHSEESDRKQ